MESAIDKSLVCPRNRPQRMPDNFAPPFPGWVGRADGQVKQYVMAYLGVQAFGAQHQQALRASHLELIRSLGLPHGPAHYDLTQYIDLEGFDNRLVIAYWSDVLEFERWNAAAQISEWWECPQRRTDGLGYFREILKPTVNRLETFYSTPDRPEGVGVVMGGCSEEIQEHGYWGSMRDRMPLAQTDALRARGHLEANHEGPQTNVTGHQNLVVIRSGQDWSDTQALERSRYLEQMEPILRQAMDYLRDEGVPIGCYSNRYMKHIDADGREIEKSFSVSHWHSLCDLERWSESHPTHVKIFGTFMQMVQTFKADLKWRGYHEVSVLEADAQRYEYINCHPRTGLLNGLKP
ncbi:aldoxime dehydratase [Pseudomonas sp. Y3 TE3536]